MQRTQISNTVINYCEVMWQWLTRRHRVYRRRTFCFISCTVIRHKLYRLPFYVRTKPPTSHHRQPSNVSTNETHRIPSVAYSVCSVCVCVSVLAANRCSHHIVFHLRARLLRRFHGSTLSSQRPPPHNSATFTSAMHK